MKWRTDVIAPGCLAAARQLVKFPWLNEFYLAGGTALALMFGHRLSVDLDFFSESNELKFLERQRIVKDLSSLDAKIEEEIDGTLHVRHRSTHLSFFVYRYPLLRPMKKWDAIQIADPLDIGLMKLGAIIGRGSRKDFYDLHQIILHVCPLKKMLRLSKKKFKDSRDFQLQACRALVYFDDADREPALRSAGSNSWPEIKRFFEMEVRQIMESTIK